MASSSPTKCGEQQLLVFFISCTILLSSHLLIVTNSQPQPVASGLSWTFFNSTCPQLESIVRTHLQQVFRNDTSQAAGLLRLHFHDCFVQGCDGSVLLNGSASGSGEQQATPNLTLRPEALRIIEDLRRLVHQQCGAIVSCADITTLAARDSVFLSGGPDYNVPLGRKDGLGFATINATLANIPPPSTNASTLLSFLATKSFNPTDVVALSGAHTIGISHCSSFTARLYPNQDSKLNNTLANTLKRTCPTSNSSNTVVMDPQTPNLFDNKYYVNLINRQGLFTSDQDLYSDNRTRGIVTSFAQNQTLFFEKFVDAIIKMGQLSVLTGSQGEIRTNCSRTNSNNLWLPVVEVAEGVLEL